MYRKNQLCTWAGNTKPNQPGRGLPSALDGLEAGSASLRLRGVIRLVPSKIRSVDFLTHGNYSGTKWVLFSLTQCIAGLVVQSWVLPANGSSVQAQNWAQGIEIFWPGCIHAPANEFCPFPTLKGLGSGIFSAGGWKSFRQWIIWREFRGWNPLSLKCGDRSA